jgi:CubicO group peptidase (beta-lactamase class C family)
VAVRDRLLALYGGYGDLDASAHLSDRPYRIGSITKTYTAVMIFQLIEEGKLKLNETLDKFFPQIPNAAKITLEQILSHHSGIHNMEPDPSWGRQARTRDEVLARIAEGNPDFEPGTAYKYSNSGYVLLGYIVEKVDGKPYQEILKNRIAAKIGLKDTYLGVGQTDASRNEALSYHYLGSWKEASELDLSIPAGAGAILSTAADMAKFAQALFEGKLVSKDSLKQMMTLRDGEGMGLVPFTFAGRTLYGNTGGSGSSGAWLAYDPEEKLALAYMTNAKIYPVSNIVNGIFDIYWDRPFQIPALDAFQVSPEVLDRYVGVYVISGTPAKMTITRDGGTLFIRAGEQQSVVPLEATAENKFKIDPGVAFEFDAAKGLLTIKRPNGERVFTKQQ